MTQPCRSFKDRFVGYLALKILQATCKSAEVDLHTVDKLFHKMVELEETMGEKKHCVVLAPTHRSIMDYILVKYITFNMCGMGLDMPLVLAGSELEDNNLSEKIERRKAHCDRHVSVAAFLEGSPSSDGRVNKLNKEAIKTLAQVDGDYDVTVLPMSMNYESVNDSEILLQATKTRSDLGLTKMFSLYWQICVLKKTKPTSLGDVRVSFGVPSKLESTADVDAAAKNLQAELERLSSSSSP